MGFAADLKKVCDRAGDKVDLFVKASVLGLGSSIVKKSPVDTGRFKGNWQYGQDAINQSVESPPDKSGNSALNAIKTGLDNWVPGQTIYITNSLPYSKRLEYGWSSQASAGVVRLSVQEFKRNIKKSAKAIT